MPMLMLAVYALLILVLHFLGTLDPGPANWATHAYGFLGGAWLFAGVLAGAGVALAVALAPERLWSRLGKAGPLVVAMLAGGVLFWAGRERTFFLGDGAFLIQCIERGVLIWHNEPATLFGVAYLHRVLGAPDAAAMMAVISVVLGVVYLGLAGWFARVIATNGWDRCVVFLFLALAGLTRLFYGYVETYPVLVILTLAYAVTALRAVRGESGLAAPVLLATVAPAFHITGFFLWPSLLVLVARGGATRSISRWLWLVFPGLLVAAGFAVLGGNAEAVSSIYERYLAKFVALSGPLDIKSAYTLFSPGHISDFFQEQVILGPMAALLGLVLLVLSRPKQVGPEGRLLLWVAVPWWVFSFLYKRELGAARDWDLFSAAAVPWVLLVAWLWSRLPGPRFRSGSFRAVTGLVLGVAAFHLVGWVGVDVRPETGIARFAVLNQPDAPPSPWARSYAFEELGTYYLDAEDLDAAVGAFTEAIFADSTNARAYGFLGASLRAQGNLDGAIQVLEPAARRLPWSSGIQFQLGSTYALAGQPEGARLALRRAWELDPGNIDVILNLIAAELAYSDPASAEAVARAAMERYPAEPRLPANLARALEDQGRMDEAIAAYRSALELGATDPAVRFNLGRILLQTNRPDEAVTELQTQVAEFPSDYEAWVNLGSAEERLGRAEQAEISYRRATAEDPRRPEAYFSLARMHLATGDTSSARQALFAYTRVDSTSRQAELARVLLSRLGTEP